MDNERLSCCKICVGSNQIMCVAYYPKLAIEKHFWSNKWRCLKASFHGLDNLPIEVKECRIHLIHAQYIPGIVTDTNDAHRKWDNNQLMIEYNDERNEDANASAKTSYHQIQITKHNNPPMDTVGA